MALKFVLSATIKRLARFVLGDYAIYRIYRCSVEKPPADLLAPQGTRFGIVDAFQISSSEEAAMSEQAWYAGNESSAYACFDGTKIIGLCFFWFGDRYGKRGFLDLDANEAKLVQVLTLPDSRGRGVAASLLGYAARDMFSRGFDRLYARVWVTNTPSIRAFSRAGWADLGWITEINPLGRLRPLRLRWLRDR